MSRPHQDLAFRSADGRFGLTLPTRPLSSLLAFAKKAGRTETGGVFVGRYNDALDCAHVTEVSGPPRGSQASGTSFVRSAEGLAHWLERIWRAGKGAYYLGEWHFHPFASPAATACDREQMADVATDPAYRCTEPLLLILGGDPRKDWEVRAYVFPGGVECIPLGRKEAK